MLRFKLVIITAVILFAGSIFAQGIENSKHDFSGESWTTEICNVCHTPHNANTDVTGAPLWNHGLTEVSAYTLYTSHTLTATLGEPDGGSKLCLSCHDGTVAIDNYGGETAGTIMIGAYSGTSPYSNIGSDINDDHPISFVYDATLATTDGTLFDPTSQSSGVGAGTVDEDLLRNHKLECSSCHDAHDTAGNDYMLVKANTTSALCLTCHNK